MVQTLLNAFQDWFRDAVQFGVSKRTSLLVLAVVVAGTFGLGIGKLARGPSGNVSQDHQKQESHRVFDVSIKAEAILKGQANPSHASSRSGVY